MAIDPGVADAFLLQIFAGLLPLPEVSVMKIGDRDEGEPSFIVPKEGRRLGIEVGRAAWHPREILRFRREDEAPRFLGGESEIARLATLQEAFDRKRSCTFSGVDATWLVMVVKCEPLLVPKLVPPGNFERVYVLAPDGSEYTLSRLS